jgi:hypothetical protein
MVAGPSKGPDCSQRPSTSTVLVDVDVDVLVHVDVFFKSEIGVKHTSGNVKLPLPPRQSRGIAQRIRMEGGGSQRSRAHGHALIRNLTPVALRGEMNSLP